ncbi:MAG: hypothetical protein LBQ13_03150 [Endomicrobium sp.]|jgi:hypothetical protein|nr:hypothetical protein [Endomicrobium sp.]
MKIKGLYKIMMLTTAMFFILQGEAKLKGLPTIKSYKDYNIGKNNVESLKYTVYSPKLENGVAVPGEIADFIAEIFFDDKGNKIKEKVYHIETGKLESTTNWTYNEKDGSVIQTRTDSKNEQVYRIEYIVNYKGGTVLSRKYENFTDINTGEARFNVFTTEELWTENAKTQTLKYEKTLYSLVTGEAVRRSTREYPLEKPYTLYTTLDEITTPIDYTWEPDYREKLFKATNSKTRKEDIYNGTQNQYKAKKKLLSNILTYDSNKKLQSEITYIYKYDKKKNWIEVLQKEGDNPQFIVIREINYRK